MILKEALRVHFIDWLKGLGENASSLMISVPTIAIGVGDEGLQQQGANFIFTSSISLMLLLCGEGNLNGSLWN